MLSPADVLELARAGKKIYAIKRYRELTGVDIAHAREVIDSLD
jgi:ribosomal protein L7/L12